jgi:hypothetical protein
MRLIYPAAYKTFLPIRLILSICKLSLYNKTTISNYLVLESLSPAFVVAPIWACADMCGPQRRLQQCEQYLLQYHVNGTLPPKLPVACPSIHIGYDPSDLHIIQTTIIVTSIITYPFVDDYCTYFQVTACHLVHDFPNICFVFSIYIFSKYQKSIWQLLTKMVKPGTSFSDMESVSMNQMGYKH